MSQIHLTEEQFAEVKTMQEDGASSKTIAQELSLRLPAVNVAMKFSTFERYEANWQEHLQEFAIDDAPTGPAKVPTQRGSLRTILQAAETEDDEQIVSYKDMRTALATQIKGLWSMIALLEKRKASLEQQIRTMEDYIRNGVIFAEKHIENGD